MVSLYGPEGLGFRPESVGISQEHGDYTAVLDGEIRRIPALGYVNPPSYSNSSSIKC